MTGPISEAGSVPGPTTIFSARALIAGTSFSSTPPTVTITGRAMQRWPAAPNAPALMCCAANSMSASGMTIAWLFAPPRAWTRLPWATPVSCTMWATGVEPTKEMASIPGWVRMSVTR